MYRYNARLLRVVESDTVEARIDLGFNINIEQRIKLYGVTTVPATEGQSTPKQRLADKLNKNFIVDVIFSKKSKAGRVLGIIYNSDAKGDLININHYMIENGYAKEFKEQK